MLTMFNAEANMGLDLKSLVFTRVVQRRTVPYAAIGCHAVTLCRAGTADNGVLGGVLRGRRHAAGCAVRGVGADVRQRRHGQGMPDRPANDAKRG